MAAATTCAECDGAGVVFLEDDATECPACDGTGATLEAIPAGCIICDAPVPAGTDLCHQHKWFARPDRPITDLYN